MTNKIYVSIHNILVGIVKYFDENANKPMNMFWCLEIIEFDYYAVCFYCHRFRSKTIVDEISESMTSICCSDSQWMVYNRSASKTILRFFTFIVLLIYLNLVFLYITFGSYDCIRFVRWYCSDNFQFYWGESNISYCIRWNEMEYWLKINNIKILTTIKQVRGTKANIFSLRKGHCNHKNK